MTFNRPKPVNFTLKSISGYLLIYKILGVLSPNRDSRTMIILHVFRTVSTCLGFSYYFYHIIDDNAQLRLSLLNLLFKITQLDFIFLHIFDIAILIFIERKLYNLIAFFDGVDSTFQDFCERQHQNSFRLTNRKSFTLLILQLIVIIFIEVVYILKRFFGENQFTYASLIRLYIGVFDSTIVLLFLNGLKLAKNRFRSLNQLMDYDRITEMQFVDFHAKFVEVCEKWNDLFGLNLLISITHCFIGMLLKLVQFFSSISMEEQEVTENWTQVFGIMIAIWRHGFECLWLILIVRICHKTAVEANQSAIIYLKHYKRRAKVSVTLYFYRNQLQFHACGMFRIDKSLYFIVRIHSLTNVINLIMNLFQITLGLGTYMAYLSQYKRTTG